MGGFSELLKEESKRIKVHAKAGKIQDADSGFEHLLPSISGSQTEAPVEAKVARVPVPHEIGVEGSFRVSNTELKSSSKGLKYRLSANFEDKHRNAIEEWGNLVLGSLVSEDWLLVGRLYLPVKVNGITVVHPVMNDTGYDNLEDKFEQEPFDPAQRWKTWKMPLVRATPQVTPGTGHVYEVVYDRVVGRPAPSLAAPLQSVRKKGEFVELFEFDDTRKWRRGLDDYSNLLAWWMIDHEDLGALLRPKGKPLSIRPMEPVCVAAEENLVQDLQRFLDQGCEVEVYDITGLTPLMLAAEQNCLECCVLLLEGGASPRAKARSPSKHAGMTAMQIAETVGAVLTSLLLRAISGKNYNLAKFEEMCLFKLNPDFQETVWRLVEQADKREEDEIDKFDNDPERSSPRSRPRGKAYEVAHSAVWIREEASVNAEKIAVRRVGDVVEVLEFDASGNWGRVEHEIYLGKYRSGWMLIRSDMHGELLRPAFPEKDAVDGEDVCG